jgi:hypothetical protein
VVAASVTATTTVVIAVGDTEGIRGGRALVLMGQ